MESSYPSSLLASIVWFTYIAYSEKVKRTKRFSSWPDLAAGRPGTHLNWGVIRREIEKNLKIQKASLASNTAEYLIVCTVAKHIAELNLTETIIINNA